MTIKYPTRIRKSGTDQSSKLISLLKKIDPYWVDSLTLCKLLETVKLELIAVNKNYADLEDELIAETMRANKAEERTARYEKPEEAIDLAQQIVLRFKRLIGQEDVENETVELFALRRTIEDFERVAPKVV